MYEILLTQFKFIIATLAYTVAILQILKYIKNYSTFTTSGITYVH